MCKLEYTCLTTIGNTQMYDLFHCGLSFLDTEVLQKILIELLQYDVVVTRRGIEMNKNEIEFLMNDLRILLHS